MKTYRNKKDHDERIDVSDPNVDPVIFCPQGGGMRYQLSLASFREDYEPAPAPEYRIGTVTADWMPGVVLPCYSNGDHWNGWGMPYFARAEVDRLIAQSERENLDPMRWDGDKVIGSSDVNDGEYRDEYEPVTMPDGSLAWGIGAGSWCWDDVEFDTPAP